MLIKSMHYRFQINNEIKVRIALNIQPKLILDELYSVFGDEDPSYNTVAKWLRSFQEGRADIQDQARPPGQPVTETTTEHFEEVCCLIDGDPHLTIDEI